MHWKASENQLIMVFFLPTWCKNSSF